MICAVLISCTPAFWKTRCNRFPKVKSAASYRRSFLYSTRLKFKRQNVLFVPSELCVQLPERSRRDGSSGLRWFTLRLPSRSLRRRPAHPGKLLRSTRAGLEAAVEMVAVVRRSEQPPQPRAETSLTAVVVPSPVLQESERLPVV